MNGIRGKLWLKLVAFFALVIFAVTAVLSGLGALWLYSERVYFDGGESMMKETLSDELYSKTMNMENILLGNNATKYETVALPYYNILDILEDSNEKSLQSVATKNSIEGIAKYFDAYYAEGMTNLVISIKNTDGELLYQNFTPESTYISREETFDLGNPSKMYEFTYVYTDDVNLQNFLQKVRQQGNIVETEKSQGEGTNGKCRITVYPKYGNQIVVTMSLSNPLQIIDGTYFEVDLLTRAISIRNWLLPICIASALMVIACFIYLMVSAGYNDRQEGISLAWWHKIPFEIYCFVCVVLVAYAIAFVDNYYGQWGVIGGIAVLAIMLLTIALCGILLINTFVVRCKTCTLFKYTITIGSLIIIWKFLKLIFKNISYTWRVILTFSGVFVYELVCLLIVVSGYWNFGLGLWLMGKVVVGAVAILYAVGIGRVSKACKEISQGNSKPEINNELMPRFIIEFGADVKNIGEGVGRAVEQSLKSERLKTELITNVSHDLKTPLTSIVNYVDILSKQDIEPLEAKEHVEILVRQSQRMKKLIDDLIEASKASSGAIAVNLERANVATLLSQSLVEYQEKLEKCELETILQIAQEELYANIDGRLTWRVLDNLFGNVCKYAQPGTRVYVTLEEVGSKIKVNFKNISRYQLNISADELMERFKRGDASRSTEGSGLGLAIANDLCRLQGIDFKIAIDGDLYKVELILDKIK